MHTEWLSERPKFLSKLSTFYTASCKWLKSFAMLFVSLWKSKSISVGLVMCKKIIALVKSLWLKSKTSMELAYNTKLSQS
jgi:hypothetical protein